MYDEHQLAEIEQALSNWESTSLKEALEKMGEWKKEFTTSSGLTAKRLYTPLDLKAGEWNYLGQLGFPGGYPFTRGIEPVMYRSKLFRMYQYGGYGTAKATNEWFKYIIERGAEELGVAQDLPTQLGLDSDHPLARPEVGKVGVAIGSLADIEAIFKDIPIERIGVSTTSNATGPIFLAFMLALCEKRKISPQKLRLNIQNDILKEFIARGAYIFPPRPSMEFACDLREYCINNGLINVRPGEFCGYHMREAGANVIQELAFTLANAVAYLECLKSRGVDLNKCYQPVAGFTAGLDLFEEICKLRAFRRMFSRTMKERFNVSNPDAMAVSYRCNSQASLFTAQEPMNNIVRGAITALVQALAGVQVMSVACFDEAHALPSPEAVKIALRTQQIVAYETGVVNTVDPLAGSYYVEALTDELEEKAMTLFEKVQAMGGAIASIEQGFQIREIARSALKHQQQVESGERVMIGVNKYRGNEAVHLEVRRPDEKDVERQIERLNKLRKERDNDEVKIALNGLKEAAREGANLVLPALATVKAYATIGEMCDVLRDVWGEYEYRAEVL